MFMRMQDAPRGDLVKAGLAKHGFRESQLHLMTYLFTGTSFYARP